MKKVINTREKGFTIIELVVVIVIIGILLLLAMPRFNGYVKGIASNNKNIILMNKMF